MEGREVPNGISERRARRILLERKIEAFDLIAQRESGKAALDARVQSGQAWDELVAWHREDLDLRLAVDGVEDLEGLEGYRFTLDDRPVAQLEFTAAGSPQDTGWYLFSIDATAFDAAPDEPLRWLGDPWPLNVARCRRRRARRVRPARGPRRAARRGRPGRAAHALAAARRELLGDLASDLAKGVGSR